MSLIIESNPTVRHRFCRRGGGLHVVNEMIGQVRLSYRSIALGILLQELLNTRYVYRLYPLI